MGAKVVIAAVSDERGEAVARAVGAGALMEERADDDRHVDRVGCDVLGA